MVFLIESVWNAIQIVFLVGAIAVAVVFARRGERQTSAVPRRPAIAALITAAATWGALIALQYLPYFLPLSAFDQYNVSANLEWLWMFAPVGGAIAGLVAFALTAPARTSSGRSSTEADLAPRSFSDGVVLPLRVVIVVAVLMLAFLVIAGRVSDTFYDDGFPAGEIPPWGHRLLVLEALTVYGWPGWFYSIPVLAGLAICAVLVARLLVSSARAVPPTGAAALRHGSERRLLSRTVVALAWVAVFGSLGRAVIQIGDGLQVQGFIVIDGVTRTELGLTPEFGLVWLLLGGVLTAAAVAALLYALLATIPIPPSKGRRR